MTEETKNVYQEGDIDEFRFDLAQRVAAAVISAAQGYTGVDYMLKTLRRKDPNTIGGLWVHAGDILLDKVMGRSPSDGGEGEDET